MKWNLKWELNVSWKRELNVLWKNEFFKIIYLFFFKIFQTLQFRWLTSIIIDIGVGALLKSSLGRWDVFLPFISLPSIGCTFFQVFIIRFLQLLLYWIIWVSIISHVVIHWSSCIIFLLSHTVRGHPKISTF